MPHSFASESVTAAGQRFVCATCGHVVKSPPLGFDLHRVHPECGATPTSAGLGDRLAGIFASLGIKECGGCARRKEWLNKTGRRIAKLLQSRRRR